MRSRPPASAYTALSPPFAYTAPSLRCCAMLACTHLMPAPPRLSRGCLLPPARASSPACLPQHSLLIPSYSLLLGKSCMRARLQSIDPRIHEALWQARRPTIPTHCPRALRRVCAIFYSPSHASSLAQHPGAEGRLIAADITSATPLPRPARSPSTRTSPSLCAVLAACARSLPAQRFSLSLSLYLHLPLPSPPGNNLLRWAPKNSKWLPFALATPTIIGLGSLGPGHVAVPRSREAQSNTLRLFHQSITSISLAGNNLRLFSQPITWSDCLARGVRVRVERFLPGPVPVPIPRSGCHRKILIAPSSQSQ
ncbi:hypothetical protein B0H13DRAFT_2307871 [Mycena leptocephala]|nr:hypothetical protein B0H13DRAFT_2307871 [Mycena leptocephala]